MNRPSFRFPLTHPKYPGLFMSSRDVHSNYLKGICSDASPSSDAGRAAFAELTFREAALSVDDPLPAPPLELVNPGAEMQVRDKNPQPGHPSLPPMPCGHSINDVVPDSQMPGKTLCWPCALQRRCGRDLDQHGGEAALRVVERYYNLTPRDTSDFEVDPCINGSAAPPKPKLKRKRKKRKRPYRNPQSPRALIDQTDLDQMDLNP